jgi:hypothetical protein
MLPFSLRVALHTPQGADSEPAGVCLCNSEQHIVFRLLVIITLNLVTRPYVELLNQYLDYIPSALLSPIAIILFAYLVSVWVYRNVDARGMRLSNRLARLITAKTGYLAKPPQASVSSD